VLGAVAIHPNDAPKLAGGGTLEEALTEIEQLAAHPRIRAIGETGLDYFRTPEEGIERQRYSFRRHLDIAKRLGLALQIHDRDAHDDVVSTVLSEGAPERVVLHCFSGDAGLARTCNENGWYMSFAGTVTFKNAANLREALAIAEPSLILAETDSPFLTPHPTGASRTPPMSCRTLCGRWPRYSEPTWRSCARGSRPIRRRCTGPGTESLRRRADTPASGVRSPGRSVPARRPGPTGGQGRAGAGGDSLDP
jgi:TatD DNase family protein